eukprot:2889744-Pleurochrysis_carterae.AAC.1
MRHCRSRAPPGGQIELVRSVGHCDEVRELSRLDHRVAASVVVRVALLAVAAAALPIVVEPNVAIAEVAQRRWLAVHQPGGSEVMARTVECMR